MPKLAALPKKKELSEMPIKDLKVLCSKRDVAQGGSKDDIIKRLLDFQKASDKAAAAKASPKPAVAAKSVVPPAPANANKAAEEKAAADAQQKALEEKVAAERAAKEIAEKKAAEERAAAEAAKKAADERAAQEEAKRKAEEAEKKAAEERAAAEAAKKAADEKAAQEEAKRKAEEAEKKAAEEKAAQVAKRKAEEASAVASVQTSGIAPGLMVTLQGLSKVELNGKRAEVKMWLQQLGRWQCQLTEEGTLLNFRPRNIVPDDCAASQVDISKQHFEGQCVLVGGLESKPELNGQHAEAVEWLAEKSRWRCQLISSDEQCNLKPVNLTQVHPGALSTESKRRKLSDA